MSKTVIEITNLGKQYRLGQVGTTTLSDDFKRWWYNVRGKDDPFLIIGEENDRTKKGGSDYVWALKDINFSVLQGEVIGIIGKNGAGKSTLLKILSRTTSPSIGEYKVKGRIASLLEVGTGFHPDLTGRENVFLNGAILGMTKTEIRNKFDEIVDFSGVERYIDTPVKRYSSGMYVRLAFAVAAHLEPEILIVDEVLAVGDAEFQKKCLGKMKDVSGQGRTVLFVSHNMSAVNSLCTRCVYMKNGTIHSIGDTTKIVETYLSNENNSQSSVSWNESNALGDDIAKIISARVIDGNYDTIDHTIRDQKIGIEFNYSVQKSGYNPIPNIHVFNGSEEYAFVGIESEHNDFSKVGKYQSVVWIPENLLNDGRYIFGVALTTMSPNVIVHFYAENALQVEVIEDINKRSTSYNQKLPGVLRPVLNWETKYLS
jgi:lipopolysaccharide transport system ATP-binding protein